MVKTCCISECKSGSLKDRRIRSSQNIKQASLFGIPKDATLLAQWSSILNMTLTKYHYICDYHFKEEDIAKSRKIYYSGEEIQEHELKRWTLLPNAVPVNLLPRQYDSEISENLENLHFQTVKIINHDEYSKKSTVNVRKPFQQLDNRIIIKKKPAPTSIEKNSPLRVKIPKITNSDDKYPQCILQKTSLNSMSDQQVDNMQIPVNNVETTFDAEQVSSNGLNSNDSPKTVQELFKSFMSVIPPYWYYIVHDNELVFGYQDPFKLTEQLKVFIKQDFSVMVSFKQHEPLSLNLKVTTPNEFYKLLEQVKRTPVCGGTGIREMSVSGKCCGLILNSYKRLPRNPRCTACRTLRDRLFTKAARQRNAANKKYIRPIQLKRLTKQKDRLQKKAKKMSSVIKTIRDKFTQISDKSFKRRIQSLDESQRLVVTTFFETAKKSNSKGRRYRLEWIYECLLIRFKSGSLYEMLRKRNILPLPSKSTLEKYIRKLNSSAYGFQPALFQCMKKRGENMPLCERRGELVIDEMQLASGVSFNTNTKDFIGLVNLGDHTPDNLKNTVGDHALVFQFVPFKGGKSQALACFISKNAVTSQILQKLILECIILLGNAGFHVDAVTSDGAQWNRAVWKILGIDETKLSCPHPCDETKKLWMISDFAHLIKCFRNSLMENEAFVTPYGTVKKSHWKAVLSGENYQGANLKIAHKLTRTHLDPVGYQKMRVSLAYELFSDRVAIAMKKLNEANDGNEDLKAITDFLDFLEEWESGMESLGYSMSFSNSTLVGFKVTLASTLEITNMMHNDCGFEYFMTSRLSQDYLEQLFSIMRYSCGSNEHPDAKLFLQVFRLFCLFSLIQPPKGSNVTGVELLQSFIQDKESIKASKKTHEEWILKLDETLENCVLTGDQPVICENEISQNETSDIDNSKELKEIDLPKTVRGNEDKLIDHDYNVTYTSEQVLAYLAGYVSRKMKKKYEFCKNCFDSLSSAGSVEENQQNELIDELSLYGGLTYPSKGLFELTRQLENSVLDVVGKNGINGNTIQIIFDKITQMQLLKIGCQEHSQLLTREIIIYYLTMRGHFLAKTLNKEHIEKKNKSKMYKKLSKL